MTNHPNTATSAFTGALVVVVLWLVELAGVVIPQYVAAAIATLVIGAALFVGRRFKLTGTTANEAAYDRSSSSS